MHFDGTRFRGAAIALALAGALYPRGARAAETVAAETSGPAPASERFASAVQLYKHGEMEEALGIFREVAESTQSPNALLYVGHCLVQLKRYVEAHAAFLVTLKEAAKYEGDKYEPAREAAAAQLSWLALRVTKLVITAPSLPRDVVVRVDGATIDLAAIGSELVATPGAHRVEAAAPSVYPVTRDVEGAAGETKLVALSFEKRPPELTRTVAAPPTRTEKERAPYPAVGLAGVAVAGVGVAGLALFAVAGLGAKAAHDDLERDCSAMPCSDQEHRERISRGKTLQTLANAGLATGAVGILAGGTLLYFGFFQRSERRVALDLRPQGATVGYSGSF